MTPEQIGALGAFVVAIADHFDAPGPSPEKTAEHYQLAQRARLLRAIVLNDIDAGWPAPTPADLRTANQLTQHAIPGADHATENHC